MSAANSSAHRISAQQPPPFSSSSSSSLISTSSVLGSWTRGTPLTPRPPYEPTPARSIRLLQQLPANSAASAAIVSASDSVALPVQTVAPLSADAQPWTAVRGTPQGRHGSASRTAIRPAQRAPASAISAAPTAAQLLAVTSESSSSHRRGLLQLPADAHASALSAAHQAAARARSAWSESATSIANHSSAAAAPPVYSDRQQSRTHGPPRPREALTLADRLDLSALSLLDRIVAARPLLPWPTSTTSVRAVQAASSSQFPSLQQAAAAPRAGSLADVRRSASHKSASSTHVSRQPRTSTSGLAKKVRRSASVKTARKPARAEGARVPKAPKPTVLKRALRRARVQRMVREEVLLPLIARVAEQCQAKVQSSAAVVLTGSSDAATAEAVAEVLLSATPLQPSVVQQRMQAISQLQRRLRKQANVAAEAERQRQAAERKQLRQQQAKAALATAQEAAAQRRSSRQEQHALRVQEHQMRKEQLAAAAVFVDEADSHTALSAAVSHSPSSGIISLNPRASEFVPMSWLAASASQLTAALPTVYLESADTLVAAAAAAGAMAPSAGTVLNPSVWLTEALLTAQLNSVASAAVYGDSVPFVDPAGDASETMAGSPAASESHSHVLEAPDDQPAEIAVSDAPLEPQSDFVEAPPLPSLMDSAAIFPSTVPPTAEHDCSAVSDAAPGAESIQTDAATAVPSVAVTSASVPALDIASVKEALTASPPVPSAALPSLLHTLYSSGKPAPSLNSVTLTSRERVLLLWHFQHVHHGPQPRVVGACRRHCRQLFKAHIDARVCAVLAELRRLELRARERDPVRAAQRPRYVCGLKQVRKLARRSATLSGAATNAPRLQCVVLAANIEAHADAGGLDDQLDDVMLHCAESRVPVVFAMDRARLARAVGLDNSVSIVAILNYNGCDDDYKALLAETAAAQEEWAMFQCDTLMNPRRPSDEAEAARVREEDAALLARKSAARAAARAELGNAVERAEQEHRDYRQRQLQQAHSSTGVTSATPRRRGHAAVMRDARYIQPLPPLPEDQQQHKGARRRGAGSAAAEEQRSAAQGQQQQPGDSKRKSKADHGSKPSASASAAASESADALYTAVAGGHVSKRQQTQSAKDRRGHARA